MPRGANPGLDARWLAVPGARLRLHTSGAGTALVLLHGWAMDHRVFGPQLAPLARHFRVVTYDRRGFGRSGGEPDAQRELDDLDAVADALIGEPFHLLGLSQGGRIALRYAATRPGRVRSLILQGPAVDGQDTAGPGEARIPLEDFAALAAAGRLDELRRRWLEHPLMQPGKEHPEAVRLLRDMVGDYAGADLLDDRWRAYQEGPDVVDIIAASAIPLLVLTGAAETGARRRIARVLLDRVPGARELRLARSGHLGNLTEPDVYNGAVIGFCEEVDARRPGSPAGAGD